MFRIDTQNKQATPLKKASFSDLKLSERQDLQEWIVNHPHILGENLLIIQKEFAGFSDTGERLDLLALDEKGQLVIIENKLDDSGRDVTWQALKYVSYCATLTRDEIEEIFQKYLDSTSGGSAEEKIAEFFDEQDNEEVHLNTAEKKQRIILVAAHFRKEVTSTVLWLRDNNIDIKCVKITPYTEDEKLYLYAEQIIPVPDIEEYQIRLAAKKQDTAAASEEENNRRKLFYRFWEKALTELHANSNIFGNASPSDSMWIYEDIGHEGINFCAGVGRNRLRIELYINTYETAQNKKIFHALLAQKDIIEQELCLEPGIELDWVEHPTKHPSCIRLRCKWHRFDNENNWDTFVNFLTNYAPKLYHALKPRLDATIKD